MPPQKKVPCPLFLFSLSLSRLSTGGERVWRWRGRGSPGRVDSSVWGVCMEARGGCPLPSQGHWRAAVGNRGAVRAADPRSDWSSCHVEPQPAQPLEGHGGHLYEAQREPGGQPRLQSHTHWVLTPAFLLFFCHFPFFLSVLHVYQPPLPQPPSLVSLFSLVHFSISLWGDSAKVCHESGYNEFILSILNDLFHIHCVVGNTTWILKEKQLRSDSSIWIASEFGLVYNRT